ncbi:hypothetical protein Poli38472_001628 [Pythium oligandrum]|uniref:Uncharacterized protein n=1 Tax=Pythium oligandrum TaxID=41045 RepID=A0A8K1CT76_PYTOL|nr:hypothetical protein Poli38472_001628 [Pythium oligandrum]|eukprot:TMW69472.1 hypothetical protein Poli38472_001628 [Pythium oligandrum]
MVSDDTEPFVEPAFRAFFWIFAAVALVLFYFAMGYARKYRTVAAFVLPPFICFCLIFDNAVMATSGLNRDSSTVRAMLAFHSCVIPMILLVCYEVAYLVHKQKSVNFCGISFESGHRRMLGRNALSTCQRFFVWLIAIALLVIDLLASYHWQNEPAEIKSVYALEGDSTTHAVFSVVPALVLVLLSLYIGLQLWNYGTFYSYMVHATCFNPWIWMLVGSIALLTGYLMPEPLYALTSNAGELIMVATIVRMFREVHHDMQQGQQMRNFIDPIPTVSPQSQSRSANGLVLDGSKYSPMSASITGTGTATPTYLEVLTPRDTGEVRLTVDTDAAATATVITSPLSSSFSVVVTSSRTNPLFQ